MSRQDSLFTTQEPRTRNQEPVECLGKTFDSDEARREHFLVLLREGLEELHAKLGGVPFTTVDDAVERMKSVEIWLMGDDARLRELGERMRHADPSKDLLQRWKDEVGFPHGEIEDILNLSDPPYYTACPNPFIVDFIKHYGKPYDPDERYFAEPYAGDLVATRNNSFVNAHSYATKVPHEIVMKLILNYTHPGDLILDAFAGTGMTAVAAQLCNDHKALNKVGIELTPEGCLRDGEGRTFNPPGPRNVVIGDLCPAASFLAANFNLQYNGKQFESSVQRIIKALNDECGWMYETTHNRHSSRRITCTLWSDVFVCPECGKEFIFWKAAVNIDQGIINDPVKCYHCSAETPKCNLDRAWVTRFDDMLGKPVRQFKQVPVLILYEHQGRKYEKHPDDNDLVLLDRIGRYQIPYWFPMNRMPVGEESRRNDGIGLTHVHHFFTKRNLASLACAWAHADDLRSRFMLTSLMYKSSILSAPLMSNYFAAKKGKPRGGWVGKERSGTLYCPSIHSEVPLWSQIKSRSSAVRITAASERLPLITTGSASDIQIPDSTVDYIFTDPPFGANKMYSELNFLWEAWLQVRTDNAKEAVKNKAQKKDLTRYEGLIKEAFTEYYRILKPGRWITVEFSNTSNAVWNALQNALGSAGFIVADVRSLDKKQGSILGYTTSTATRQDLAISAYKPNSGLENRYNLTAGTEGGVWDFIRAHLNKLPVFVSKNGKAEVIAERLDYLLFDRMVAFHVQRGVTVPLSAGEFYAGLAQRFPERDGMYFLPEQVAEYDKKRMKVKEILQLQLFVIDEASAIQWLKQQLIKKPQTFQELHPQFLKEIGGWQKYEKPLELSELLEQNFLRYGSKGEVPSQIHSYLSSNFKELRNLAKDDERLRVKAKDRWYVPDPNKASDLERLRERALLRVFQEYRESKQKRLKVFRLEAVRAGFKKAWQERDYATIIAVARKIPENVLQEDPKLLMWYDQALTRMGEEGGR